jgi:tight adherence protein B
MGAVVGLVAGVGLLLIANSGRRRRPPNRSVGPTRRERTAELLAQAGYTTLRPRQLYVVCAGVAVVVFLGVVAVSRSPVIAVAFAGFGGYSPMALVRMRSRQRSTELRDLWPDVVDNLASAVRAGMSLPEAMSALALRGPSRLSPAFAAFAEDYRATGRFADCLDRLGAALADPVADRVIESMRVAREVGGSDLGRVLRTLSAFLRDDARTRAELETRQGWTVNAARLALAAPWIVLGMLALRPDTVAAYDTGGGVLVLAIGAAVSILAYRVMLRIARLPREQRVLR